MSCYAIVFLMPLTARWTEGIFINQNFTFPRKEMTSNSNPVTESILHFQAGLPTRGVWGSGNFGYRSGTFGYRSGTFGYRSGTFGYRSGTFGSRSETTGFRSGTFGYRSGTFVYRSGTFGFRSVTLGYRSGGFGFRSANLQRFTFNPFGISRAELNTSGTSPFVNTWNRYSAGNKFGSFRGGSSFPRKEFNAYEPNNTLNTAFRNVQGSVLGSFNAAPWRGGFRARQHLYRKPMTSDTILKRRFENEDVPGKRFSGVKRNRTDDYGNVVESIDYGQYDQWRPVEREGENPSYENPDAEEFANSWRGGKYSPMMYGHKAEEEENKDFEFDSQGLRKVGSTYEYTDYIVKEPKRQVDIRNYTSEEIRNYNPISYGNLTNMCEVLKESGLLVSQRVEDALLLVDRSHFVNETPYAVYPVDLGYGATISPPEEIVYALEVLKDKLVEGCRVLDVGCGSGYMSTLMATMVGEKGQVVAIDHIRELVENAFNNVYTHYPELIRQNKIRFECTDGRLGYVKGSPYDVIYIGASDVKVPKPLVQQMKPGGKLIMPVNGPGTYTEMIMLDKTNEGFITKTLLESSFVGSKYDLLTVKENQLKMYEENMKSVPSNEVMNISGEVKVLEDEDDEVEEDDSDYY